MLQRAALCRMVLNIQDDFIGLEFERERIPIMCTLVAPVFGSPMADPGLGVPCRRITSPLSSFCSLSWGLC